MCFTERRKSEEYDLPPLPQAPVALPATVSDAGGTDDEAWSSERPTPGGEASDAEDEADDDDEEDEDDDPDDDQEERLYQRRQGSATRNHRNGNHRNGSHRSSNHRNGRSPLDTQARSPSSAGGSSSGSSRRSPSGKRRDAFDMAKERVRNRKQNTGIMEFSRLIENTRKPEQPKHKYTPYSWRQQRRSVADQGGKTEQADRIKRRQQLSKSLPDQADVTAVQRAADIAERVRRVEADLQVGTWSSPAPKHHTPLSRWADP